MNVEPGAYWPWMARLRSGLSGSSLYGWNASTEMPPTNSPGSNVGADAIATTDPSAESSTTVLPPPARKFSYLDESLTLR